MEIIYLMGRIFTGTSQASVKSIKWNCRAFAHNIRFIQVRDRWTDSWKNRLHLWKHVAHFLRAEKDFLFNELTKQNLGGGVNFSSIFTRITWGKMIQFDAFQTTTDPKMSWFRVFHPVKQTGHSSGSGTDGTLTPMGVDPATQVALDVLTLSPLGFRHFDRNQWNRRVLVSRNSRRFKEMSEIAKDCAKAAKYRGQGWFES